MEETVTLFSYGTLQDPAVQIKNFGRLLTGRSDVLLGYKMAFAQITDLSVIATSGKSQHPIISPSENSSDEIVGTAFELNESELAAADAYEVSSYKRVSVVLKSGTQSFVYVSTTP
jgi:hypothetical protein